MLAIINMLLSLWSIPMVLYVFMPMLIAAVLFTIDLPR